jgi:hypothetical protein
LKNGNKGLFAGSAYFVSHNGEIIADSGASQHLTGNESWFRDMKKLEKPIEISIVDGKRIMATHVGTVEIEKSRDGKRWERSTWSNVYYVAEMPKNISLFSTTYMDLIRGCKFDHEGGKWR